MDGLEFINTSVMPSPDPARADIVLFVGFTRRRPGPVPLAVTRWLRERGYHSPAFALAAGRIDALLDVPVPIDSWESFDQLFAWDERVLDARQQADTLLGAAVRAFFREGGRRCLVVGLGDSPPVLGPRLSAGEYLKRLLPEPLPGPANPNTWRGLGHLLGLPEVSFACLPDLPDLVSLASLPVSATPAPAVEERFVECGSRVTPAESRGLRALAAPRCDVAGFAAWSHFVQRAGRFLERHAREVQLIVALPLPANDASFAGDPALAALPASGRRDGMRRRAQAAQAAQWENLALVHSAFVQVTYPWLRTRDSRLLPADLEPPDGTLAGMLAASALQRGAWQTVAREAARAVLDVEPLLARSDLNRPVPFTNLSSSNGGVAPAVESKPLSERVSLFGPTAGGWRLLSDVTSDEDDAWRPASVNRLMNVIVRAARLAGERFAFANSGERVWAQVRGALVTVLTQLWSEGALDGLTPAEAFEVRCDRTTMSQADLDAGRLIVRVEFTAAAPIERLVVVLALSDGGRLTARSVQVATPEAGAIP